MDPYFVLFLATMGVLISAFAILYYVGKNHKAKKRV